MEEGGINESPFSSVMEEPQLNQESLKKCGSLETTQQTINGCFDCNICLDFAADPVVTLCGHLYCWPCIYKWLQVEATSPQQCPVCKASLSQSTLVPLYGRGHTSGSGGNEPRQSLKIPRRPPSPRHNPVLELPFPQTNHRQYDPYLQPAMQRHNQDGFYSFYGYPYGHYDMFSPSFETRIIHSTAGGVLKTMAIAVLPWMFRDEDTGMHYRSSYYNMMSGDSPRLRRQEMEIMNSLSQFWIFLFCCVMGCLFLC